ncbi:hypothetical protein PZH32_11935, partial [Adlercreutzia equolifaciens]|nr:hypothetical protein [Adlercreutzia equolifaciens]
MTAFVLLHGFAQTPASWDEVAAALQAAGHRTIVPDLFAWLGEEGRDAASPVCAGHEGAAPLAAACDRVAQVVRQ